MHSFCDLRSSQSKSNNIQCNKISCLCVCVCVGGGGLGTELLYQNPSQLPPSLHSLLLPAEINPPISPI